MAKLYDRRAFIGTALSLGVVYAAPAQADRLKKSTQIYRPDLGAQSPALDIYTHSEFSKAPVLIFVHGGGWAIGNKRSVNSKPRHFSENGFVFVSLDYRIVPDVGVADQLGDIDAALGWIHENVAGFGGDPNNLHLFGHSAGAHLVTMAAVAPLPVADGLIKSGALRSVISNDTRAYDIPRIAAVSRGGRLPRLYANVFGKDIDNWKNLSPIHRLVPGKKYPAFLVLYSGQGNGAVRAEFAKDFSAALRNLGSTVSVINGSAYSHLEINRRIGSDSELTRGIDRFLAANS